MHSSIVRGFPVNCPAFAERSTVQKDNSAIEVSVDQHGQVYIGKDQTKLADIGPRLRTASQQMQSEKVLVRGDDAAAYGRVAHVLASVSRSLPDKQVILVTQMPKTNLTPEELTK